MISDERAAAARLTAPVVTRFVLLAAHMPLDQEDKERAGRRRLRQVTMNSARELKAEHPGACEAGGCDPEDGIEFLESITEAAILIYSALKKAGVIGPEGARNL